jgi:hypothetical protein
LSTEVFHTPRRWKPPDAEPQRRTTGVRVRDRGGWFPRSREPGLACTEGRMAHLPRGPSRWPTIPAERGRRGGGMREPSGRPPHRCFRHRAHLPVGWPCGGVGSLPPPALLPRERRGRRGRQGLLGLQARRPWNRERARVPRPHRARCRAGKRVCDRTGRWVSQLNR